MGWMASALGVVCSLGGYSSCSSMSTFEAIVFGGITLGALFVFLGVFILLAAQR